LSLDDDLREETEKWLRRAENAFDEITFKENEGERFHGNIAAYISDSRYFLDHGDLIRAFEAVIWAWAWMEIGEEVGTLISKDE